MKKFENRFCAFVELRNVGNSVVAAKVSTSMRLGYLDASTLSEFILARVLPEDVDLRNLYDGTFVVLSRDANDCLSNLVVPQRDRAFTPFELSVELEDGEIHKVTFTLNQLSGFRYDYCMNETRFIQLRGTISVEVEDEKIEE